MDSTNAESLIYAFTGKTKDEYLDLIIQEWNEYLAAGGDPDNYIRDTKVS